MFFLLLLWGVLLRVRVVFASACVWGGVFSPARFGEVFVLLGACVDGGF